MAFPKIVREEIFVKSARHCCVCHRYRGVKVEIHHILPKMKGGKDTFENAISLCFDCHADAGHYSPDHPKGSKFSTEELLKHKEEWFRLVEKHELESSSIPNVQLTVKQGNFEPIFIKETTIFRDKDIFKKLSNLLGNDPMEFFNIQKDENKFGNSSFYMPFFNNLKTYDEHIDFLNGDIPEKNYLKSDNENENTNCQPIKHHFPSFMSSSSIEKNLSNCRLSLKFTNNGNEVLENYKLYLYFHNVVEVDTVIKQNSISDFYQYHYNVIFSESYKAEFIPKSNVLVQKDSIELDEICFRTNHKIKKVLLKWELFAKGVYDKGDLILDINPKFEKKEITKYVENPDKIKSIVRILPKIKFE
jgi:hypothetical protein